MPTPVLILVKAVNGGLFVASLAVLGEMLQPKRFAGIFGASPAVALANLLVIALVKGDTSARNAATGMIASAVAVQPHLVPSRAANWCSTCDARPQLPALAGSPGDGKRGMHGRASRSGDTACMAGRNP